MLHYEYEICFTLIISEYHIVYSMHIVQTLNKHNRKMKYVLGSARGEQTFRKRVPP